ncbi:MAG: DUF4292 domain-containing protein [Bacteroidota bacterium]
MRYTSLLLCSLLLFAACKRHGKNNTVETGKESIRANSSGSGLNTGAITESAAFYPAHTDFKAFTGKAKFRYDDDEQGLSASASIRLLPDSLVWISISPALGIEAARCLFRKDSVFILDRLHRNCTSFSYDALGRIIGFRPDFNFVQAFVLGEDVLGKTAADNFVPAPDGRKMLKQQRNEYIAYTFHDTVSQIPVNFMMSSAGIVAGTSVNLNNSRVMPCGPRMLPYKKEITIAGKKAGDNSPLNISLIIDLSKAEFVNTVPDFPFDIPGGYERNSY